MIARIEEVEEVEVISVILLSRGEIQLADLHTLFSTVTELEIRSITFLIKTSTYIKSFPNYRAIIVPALVLIRMCA